MLHKKWVIKIVMCQDVPIVNTYLQTTLKPQIMKKVLSALGLLFIFGIVLFMFAPIIQILISLVKNYPIEMITMGLIISIIGLVISLFNLKNS